jgi:hypothetical protein
MATGQEMAMNAVFKWLGMNPEDTKALIGTTFKKVLEADARITGIENMLQAQNDMLALILKHLNGEKSNGRSEFIGTERLDE